MFDLFKNVVGSPFSGASDPGIDPADGLSPTLAFSLANSLTTNRLQRRFPANAAHTFLGALLWVALLFAASSHPVVADETTQQTSLTELRSQVSQLLRSESVAGDQATKREALTALCDLYVVLRKDSRYCTSEMLQQDAGKIRRRLLTAAGSITARQRRLKIARPNDLQHSVDDAIRLAHESAQRAAGGNTEANGDSDASSDLDLYALSAPDEKRQAAGRQAAGRQAAGRQAAGTFDNGWQLVELIQRIVAPDFWQDSGGPGVVTYFAMRRVLVVRATSDVHEQIRDLLLSLPR